ncbi:hypothetical protein [Goodfellowiella coeruleoviolacea]|uniref:CGNR zinc finger domain-containing protein n=1 Tax=Goodfellowiella coeruleoviolacea TaxID=334858 RepID=A0AAE3KJM6_9PSEU|nr:hypothetical protein [Goodfellowiella coeruleoviolacea]MCP2169252.1 hypothetical protein [Goodfellowiella coeruleoviolacea]
MQSQPTDQHANRVQRGELHVPVALLARLAAIVDHAVERHPLVFTAYAATAENSGRAQAAQQLWSDLTRSDSPVADVWNRLRHGDVEDSTTAHHALMILIALGGWDRMKRCDRPDCHRAFADATNAVSRRRCAVHARPRRAASAEQPSRG